MNNPPDQCQSSHGSFGTQEVARKPSDKSLVFINPEVISLDKVKRSWYSQDSRSTT